MSGCHSACSLPPHLRPPTRPLMGLVGVTMQTGSMDAWLALSPMLSWRYFRGSQWSRLSLLHLRGPSNGKEEAEESVD